MLREAQRSLRELGAIDEWSREHVVPDDAAQDPR